MNNIIEAFANEQLKTEAKHEVIEIVDNRTANGEFKFGGF